jgi:hypothetical protein
LRDDVDVVVDVLGITTPINAYDIVITSIEISISDRDDAQIKFSAFKPSVEIENSWK